MIAAEKLIALAAGDLEGVEAEAVDEHVLACGACAALYERLLATGDAIRDLVRGAALHLSLTPSLVDALVASGLVTRTYRMSPNGSVACTVSDTDRFVAAYLEADLHGVQRVDVTLELPGLNVRFDDVTFDVERGEVAWVSSAAFLKTLPTSKQRVRVLAIDEHGERELGAYLFDHTGYGSANSAPSS